MTIVVLSDAAKRSRTFSLLDQRRPFYLKGGQFRCRHWSAATPLCRDRDVGVWHNFQVPALSTEHS
jgi:hypothetical protein